MDLNPSLPSGVLSLLQEFEEVFIVEISDGLPPIWGIEHQINFVPEVIVPNCLIYWSNPEETKKLQQQVEELLENGYVRESLSIYDILVLLESKKDYFWRICADCRAVNKIMVKYRHHIPRLDDMLSELSRATIFIKIS